MKELQRLRMMATLFANSIGALMPFDEFGPAFGCYCSRCVEKNLRILAS